MNVKRGILIAITLYIATMLVDIIIALIIKGKAPSPTVSWIIIIIETVMLTSLASLWYFNKAKRNVKEGLKLGTTFAITGFIVNLFFSLIQGTTKFYSNISF